MGSIFSWPDVLTALLSGDDLSVSHAASAMREIMNGRATDAHIAAFLVALKVKGETVNEIVGFRDAILESATDLPVPSLALDIVGTGGDQHSTVNISTMASIVCAAAGVPVVKHGNRAASSASGSSDVLAVLGINLSLSAEKVAQIFHDVGITFAFAQAFHPGFRHVASARKDIGIPTVFNALGPLCNPARPEASAVGVAQLERIPLFVGVFQTRGASALVFRGDDGLDELTTTGHSHIWEISRGRVTEHDLDPRELGIKTSQLSDLRGGDPEHNAEIALSIFGGATGPIRDIVTLNAAAGLIAFELATHPESGNIGILDRFEEKIRVANSVLDSGEATKMLTKWAEASSRFDTV